MSSPSPVDRIRRGAEHAADAIASNLQMLRTVAATGALTDVRPTRLPAMGRVVLTHGVSPVTGWMLSAQRAPDRPAVIDDAGSITYAELDRRTNALARALQQRGFAAGDGLAVMCRNHRGFPEALLAGGKLGARLLFLNTEFAAPQLRDVLAREAPTHVIADAEFADMLASAAPDLPVYVSWHDEPSELTTVDTLVASTDDRPVAAPDQMVRFVILTSGTTGTPKGAQRGSHGSVETGASILAMIPLRAGGVSVIVPPVFHGWGFLHMGLQLALAGTMVLRRRFDPEVVLADVERHAADALVVVPVILRRILDAGANLRAAHDTSSLRVIASSGSALPGELATRAMDAFGDVLYNLYGSTEVTAATIATPSDLRRAPGTAGTPPPGTTVILFDEHDAPVTEQGGTGRIYVKTASLFEGYTGGGTKDAIDGLMATGDVGYFDDHGCLHVSGRADDMIVSGGENVFPREVEDLISDHDDVREAAVIGVPDDEYGQRLRAFVVRVDGASLDEEGVKALVKSNLARYKVPRDVVFLDELPRNPTGKVLRRVLSEHAD